MILTYNFLEVLSIQFWMVVTSKTTFAFYKIDLLNSYESLRVSKSSTEFSRVPMRSLKWHKLMITYNFVEVASMKFRIWVVSIKFGMVVISKTLTFVILETNTLNSDECLRVSKSSIEFSRVPKSSWEFWKMTQIDAKL